VCYHCSALLVSPDNRRYADTQKLRQPKKRLNAVLEICRSAKECGGGYEMDDSVLDENKEAKKGRRTGCGSQLPNYRRDGIKIIVEFPDNVQVRLVIFSLYCSVLYDDSLMFVCCMQ
jgi:DNA-directed RNA polymerase II subunit RPB1